MKTKISTTNHANGISGYDFSVRTHFETLNTQNGIAVRLQAVKGKRRYMVVSGTDNHLSAYEIARKLAPVDADLNRESRVKEDPVGSTMRSILNIIREIEFIPEMACAGFSSASAAVSLAGCVVLFGFVPVAAVAGVVLAAVAASVTVAIICSERRESRSI